MKLTLTSLILMVYLTIVSSTELCHDGWSKFDRSCYFITDNKENVQSASRTCNKLGAFLVRIESPEESNYVKTIATAKGASHYWVDGTDKFQEGVWKFISNNAPVGYTDWQTKQPDNTKTQNCIVLYKPSHYKWHDDDCNARQGYICEYKLQIKDTNSCKCSCTKYLIDGLFKLLEKQ